MLNSLVWPRRHLPNNGQMLSNVECVILGKLLPFLTLVSSAINEGNKAFERPSGHVS